MTGACWPAACGPSTAVWLAKDSPAVKFCSNFLQQRLLDETCFEVWRKQTRNGLEWPLADVNARFSPDGGIQLDHLPQPACNGRLKQTFREFPKRLQLAAITGHLLLALQMRSHTVMQAPDLLRTGFGKPFGQMSGNEAIARVRGGAERLCWTHRQSPVWLKGHHHDQPASVQTAGTLASGQQPSRASVLGEIRVSPSCTTDSRAIRRRGQAWLAIFPW